MPNPFDQFDTAGGGHAPTAQGNPFDKFDGEPAPKRSFFDGAGEAAKSILQIPAETARSVGRMAVANPISMASDAIAAKLRTLMGHPTSVGDLQDRKFKAVDDLVDPSVFEADRSKMGAGSRFLSTAGSVAGAVPEIVAAAPAFLANAAMNPATRAIDQGKDLPTAMELGGANLAVNAAGLKLPATALPVLQKMGVPITSDLGAHLARVLSGAVIQPPVSVAGASADKAILSANGYQQDADQIHPLDPESLTHAALLGAAFGGKEAMDAPRLESVLRAQTVNPNNTHAERLAAALELMNNGKQDVRPTRMPVVPPPTPAPATPEASAPQPERAGPAPVVEPAPALPPDAPPAAHILAALTGTTPPVSSVAPVRDFTSNVRTSQWGPAPEPAPAVVAPDGHPAPEDPFESLIHPDVKANDGLATAISHTSTSKKGNPSTVRKLIFRPTHDDLRTYIAANGGISPEAAKELGIDPKMGRPLRPGTANARPIAPDGMDINTLQERMAEDGWLPHEGDEGTTQHDIRNMVYDAVHRGERITHPDNTDHVRAHAADELAAHQADEALAKQQRTTVPDLYAKGERADAIAAGDRYGEIERPDHEPPIEGEIRLLRAKREAGHITPDETHRLIDLMEVDARTAKLAGGMRLHGVGNMLAEGEAPQPARKAFVDLDNFKSVNDTFGHAAGDQVIGQVAEVLRRAFPDRAFHRGGDEFVVHGASDAELHDGLTRARDALAESKLDVIAPDGQERTIPGVGLSYGVGEHIDAAESGLQADKQARAEAGLRHDRRATDTGGSAGDGGRPVEPAVAPATGAGDVRQGEASGVAGRPASAERGPNGVADTAAPGAAPEAGKADAATEPAEGLTPKPAADTPPEDATGIKNDQVDKERELKGLDALNHDLKRSDPEVHAEATKMIADDPEVGDHIAADIVDKPRALTDVEAMVLTLHRAKLENDRRAAEAAAAAAIDAGDPVAQAQALARKNVAESRADLNDRASRASSRPAGAGLRARQLMVKFDYTLAALRNKAKVALGRDLKPEEQARIEHLEKENARLLDALDQAKKRSRAARGEKIPPAAKKAADTEFNSLAEKVRAAMKKRDLMTGCDA